MLARVSTGRMCVRRCCGCGCGTSSDLASAGSGVALYFSLLKALRWVFTLCFLITLPNAVDMARTPGAPGAGVAALAKATLGEMAKSVGVDVSLPGTSAGFALTRGQMPAVFALLDLAATALLAVACVYLLAVAAGMRRDAERNSVGAEDYTVVVTGFRAACACSCGLCSPTARCCGCVPMPRACPCCFEAPMTPGELAAHFTRLADVFTPDSAVGVTPAGDGGFEAIAGPGGAPSAAPARLEVHTLGDELRLLRLVRARTSLLLRLQALEEVHDRAVQRDGGGRDRKSVV